MLQLVERVHCSITSRYVTLLFRVKHSEFAYYLVTYSKLWYSIALIRVECAKPTKDLHQTSGKRRSLKRLYLSVWSCR
jgi:hypothetical protein